MAKFSDEYGIVLRSKDETKAAVKSASKGIAGLVKVYAGLAVGAYAALKVIKVGVKFMKSSTAAAAEQELAEKKLAYAMSNTGVYSDALFASLKEQASALQRLTTVGDEATLANYNLGVSMGIPVEQLGAMGEALAGAEAAGIPAASMIRAFGASLMGTTGTLAKYVPAVKELTAEELKQGKAIELVRDQFFALAEAEKKTFSGSVKSLTNAWGDMQEVVGGVITRSPVLIASLQEITGAVVDQTEELQENQEQYISLVDRGILSLLEASKTLIITFGYVKAGVLAVRGGFDFWIAGVTTLGALLTDIVAGPIWLLLKGLEAIGLGSGAAADDLGNVIHRMNTMAGESWKAVADTGDAMKQAVSDAKGSIASIEEHQASIMANAEVIRTEGVPANQEMAGAFAGVAEAAKDAKNEIEGLNEEQIASLLISTQQAIAATEAERDELIKTAAVMKAAGEPTEDMAMLISAMGDDLDYQKGALSTYRQQWAAMGKTVEDVGNLEEDLVWLLEDALFDDLAGQVAGYDTSLEGSLARSNAAINDHIATLEESGALAGETLAEMTADFQGYGQAAESILGSIGDVFAMVESDKVKAASKALAELKAIDQALSAATTEGERTRLEAARKAKRQEVADAKEKAMDAFYTGKAFAIAQAAISTALAMVNALANTPGPVWVQIAGMVAAGVAGGVATAAIIAEPPPSFAEGGMVWGPGARGVDSVPITAAPGEFVIKERRVEGLLEALENGTLGGNTSIIEMGGSFVPESPAQFARKMDIAQRRQTREFQRLRRASGGA